jgi:hypothetical protein
VPNQTIDQRLGRFVELSVALTGYDHARLFGTGVADAYLETVAQTVGEECLDALLGAHAALPHGADGDAALTDRILADPRLGPVARSVIILWYCGAWSALPDEWRHAYGAAELDTDRVVSPASYVAGLQWVAAGAHAAGARQQGFGAWAQPPAELPT